MHGQGLLLKPNGEVWRAKWNDKAKAYDLLVRRKKASPGHEQEDSDSEAYIALFVLALIVSLCICLF